jgi:uncharacterized protein YqjF (DUF2071 family)
MTWENLLFLHWRVEPDSLRALLPRDPTLELDTFGGDAFIALVPFRMTRTRFRGYPPLRSLAEFYECNVRTYVRVRTPAGVLPGVWFFSLDAANRLPVLGGRRMWNLNYVHSRFNVTHTADNTRHDYALSRRRGPWPDGRTHAVWRTGPALPTSQPGTLEHFLTERYWLFTRRRGRIMGGRIHHEPWPLREATLESLDDTLVRAAGAHAQGEPLAWASDTIDVVGWNLTDPTRIAAPPSNGRRT